MHTQQIRHHIWVTFHAFLKESQLAICSWSMSLLAQQHSATRPHRKQGGNFATRLKATKLETSTTAQLSVIWCPTLQSICQETGSWTILEPHHLLVQMHQQNEELGSPNLIMPSVGHSPSWVQSKCNGAVSTVELSRQRYEEQSSQTKRTRIQHDTTPASTDLTTPSCFSTLALCGSAEIGKTACWRKIP